METKICKKCNENKDISLFRQTNYKRKDGGQNLKTVCRDCENQDRLYNYRHKGGKEKQKLRAQRNNLKKYGLTVDDYNNMLKKQQGNCAICSSSVSHRTNTNYNLFVDHCHTTGKVRGLLCHHCNAGLGHMKDSKEFLERAIRYLDENSS
jgi:hypothetical protein